PAIACDRQSAGNPAGKGPSGASRARLPSFDTASRRATSNAGETGGTAEAGTDEAGTDAARPPRGFLLLPRRLLRALRAALPTRRRSWAEPSQARRSLWESPTGRPAPGGGGAPPGLADAAGSAARRAQSLRTAANLRSS